MRHSLFDNSRLFLLAGASVAAIMASPVHAQAPVLSFNIPAQPAITSIPEFAKQSGLQVLVTTADLKGISTNAVSGNLTAEAALSRLISNKGLRIASDNGREVLLVKANAVPAVLDTAAVAPAQDSPIAATEPVQPDDDPQIVVVTGIRSSLQSARNIKRRSAVLVDSIVAQDIGKFPDTNIAESVSRIPGVQIGTGNGQKQEGGGIAVRGLGEIKTVLNGREVFTGDSRGFNPQDLSSLVLGGIDVYKSSEANQIEGGLGGYVNFKTRRAFDFKKPTALLSLKATYFDMHGRQPGDSKPEVSFLVADRWSTGIGEIGALLNASYGETVWSNGPGILTGTGVPRLYNLNVNVNGTPTMTTVIGNSSVGDGVPQHGNRKRTAVVGNLDWKLNDDLSLYLDGYYVDYRMNNWFFGPEAALGSGTQTPGTVATIFDGVTASLPTDSTHTLYPILKSASFSNVSASGFQDGADEFRDVSQIAVGGKWSNGGPLSIKWDLSHTKANQLADLYEFKQASTIPRVDFTINVDDDPLVLFSGIDLSDPTKQSPQYLLSIEFRSISTNDAATLDFHYDTKWPVFDSFDFGFRGTHYVDKGAYGFVNFFVPPAGFTGTMADVSAGLRTEYETQYNGPMAAFKEEFLIGERDLLRIQQGYPATDADNPLQPSVNAEKTSGFYVKGNYAFHLGGMPIDGNLGVRAIKTDYTAKGYGTDASGAPEFQIVKSTRNDILPSLNLRAEVRDGLYVKVAAGQSLGRIGFGALKGTTSIGNQALHQASSGNPDLQPFKSDNFDLSLEQYFGKDGIAYATYFHKKVNGFLTTEVHQQLIGSDPIPYNVTRPSNGPEGTIKGYEIGFTDFFDFFPAPFDGLGVQGNYTRVDAEAPSALAGQTIPLTGLSPNSYNLIALYEKGPISTRLAYTWRDDYVINVNDSSAFGFAKYSQPQSSLDASLTYNVSDHLSVVFDGVNILNNRSIRYYGSEYIQDIVGETNSRYSVTARFKY